MKLRGLVPEARAAWSREANIHLTLKFLGEIPVELVARFESAISRAVKGSSTFPIAISGSGVFPNRRDPRVLWIGITDIEQGLAKLHSQLEDESEQEGFTRDGRPFHPHLTVARLRNQQGARELSRAHQDLNFAAEQVTVNELLLIRSELSNSGSRYTTISKHMLKG
jgi:2'-5' RNA ligase